MVGRREKPPAREDPTRRESWTGAEGEPRELRDQYGRTAEEAREGKRREDVGATPGAGIQGAPGSIGDEEPPTPEDLLIEAEDEGVPWPAEEPIPEGRRPQESPEPAEDRRERARHAEAARAVVGPPIPRDGPPPDRGEHPGRSERPLYEEDPPGGPEDLLRRRKPPGGQPDI